MILLSIPGVKRLPEVQKLKQLNLCEYDLKELTKHAYFSIILLDHEMSSTLMRFCWIVPANCFIAWCWFLCSTWSASSEAAQHVAWAGDTSDQIMGLGFFLGAADNEVRADNHWQSLIYFSSYIPQPPWFLYQITTVTDSYGCWGLGGNTCVLPSLGSGLGDLHESAPQQHVQHPDPSCLCTSCR